MIQNNKLKALGALGAISFVLIFGLLYAMENQPDTTVDENNDKQENFQDQADFNKQDEQESDPQENENVPEEELLNDNDNENEFLANNNEDEPPQNSFDNNSIQNKRMATDQNNTNQSLNDMQNTFDTSASLPTTPQPTMPSTSTTEQTESEQASALAPTANQLSIKPKISDLSSLNAGSTHMANNRMPNIGLTENSRTEMANALQKLLADEYILYTKTLNFHWNVEGKHFGPLHALFNDQYEKLQSIIDNIAERIRAIGMFTHATMREFLSMSSLTEKVNDFPDDIRMLSILLADHESVIQTIRNANDFAAKINDGGSNNFLSGLLETHEKMAWMLRAHLNK